MFFEDPTSTILIVIVCCDLRLPLKGIQKRLKGRKSGQEMFSDYYFGIAFVNKLTITRQCISFFLGSNLQDPRVPASLSGAW